MKLKVASEIPRTMSIEGQRKSITIDFLPAAIIADRFEPFAMLFAAKVGFVYYL